MKKGIEKIVQRYYQRVFSSNIPIEAMYVFGSASKNTMKTASDVDICVVSPTFGKDKLKERVLLMKLRDGISDAIEPHPYSSSEFNSKYDTLAKEIKRTGIVIHSSS